MSLDREHGLLGRNIAAVDLRLADRMSVRLRDGGPVTAGVPGADAQQDVPTAGTKSGQAKGNT
jgi:hypothetical protein